MIHVGRQDRVFILTGSGVSAESGIPTFRGAGGLWRNYRVEEVASPDAWARDPALVWEFYSMRRNVAAAARPNPAHRARRPGGQARDPLFLARRTWTTCTNKPDRSTFFICTASFSRAAATPACGRRSPITPAMSRRRRFRAANAEAESARTSAGLARCRYELDRIFAALDRLHQSSPRWAHPAWWNPPPALSPTSADGPAPTTSVPNSRANASAFDQCHSGRSWARLLPELFSVEPSSSSR